MLHLYLLFILFDLNLVCSIGHLNQIKAVRCKLSCKHCNYSNFIKVLICVHITILTVRHLLCNSSIIRLYLGICSCFKFANVPTGHLFGNIFTTQFQSINKNTFLHVLFDIDTSKRSHNNRQGWDKQALHSLKIFSFLSLPLQLALRCMLIRQLLVPPICHVLTAYTNKCEPSKSSFWSLPISPQSSSTY